MSRCSLQKQVLLEGKEDSVDSKPPTVYIEMCKHSKKERQKKKAEKEDKKERESGGRVWFFSGHATVNFGGRIYWDQRKKKKG